ncbi:Dabb family protein [Opitutus terrae]|uniref:Stress responsive alpha-beta barrel domain protein n=1 Tax=Opitutus terrae (strain DSM 11246 / JCM 15787 / PB90-1) TaxID=452637 RepID=B1ZQR0_OPITP|nr:Dabb family protein [Opitutus terrae]ACB77811.1 Stress responsive alpha-beta barrel domain protein [Opitutus terrae PB90-1]
MMKKLMMIAIATGALMLGATTFAAETAPKSVIHVVTVAWKEGTTPEQIKAALDGAKALPAQFKGITRVWTKPLKIQNAPGAEVKKDQVIVMEFASEQALKDYDGSDAQKAWYKAYTPIRRQSTTFDITNE